jgi:hypothetical protein
LPGLCVSVFAQDYQLEETRKKVKKYLRNGAPNTALPVFYLHFVSEQVLVKNIIVNT